jgi:ABC-type transport system involved in Fe-S cluster assembly fused permease/ATPase subunit
VAEELAMTTARQKAAARKNIKKAAAAAKKKRTIAHLPKKTRTALGKQGASVAKKKRKRKA